MPNLELALWILFWAILFGALAYARHERKPRRIVFDTFMEQSALEEAAEKIRSGISPGESGLPRFRVYSRNESGEYVQDSEYSSLDTEAPEGPSTFCKSPYFWVGCDAKTEAQCLARECYIRDYESSVYTYEAERCEYCKCLWEQEATICPHCGNFK